MGSGVSSRSPIKYNNMWAAIISTFIGLWIMIAPEWFPFNKIEANNHFIVGPLVVTAAVIGIWEVNRSLRFFNLAAGVWMVISPLLLSYETKEAIYSSIVSGALLILFSL